MINKNIGDTLIIFLKLYGAYIIAIVIWVKSNQGSENVNACQESQS